MWAIAVFVSLSVLFLLLLCVPLDLAVRFNTDKQPKLSMELTWLFGLVRADMRKKKRYEKRVTIKHKRRPVNWEGNINIIFKVLHTRGMPKQIAHLFRGILRSLKVKELAASLKIGLDNPADTGFLFAFIAPFNLLVSSLPYQIKFEPSLNTNVLLQGHFSAIVRTQPIHLIAHLAAFVFSLPAIKVIKTLAPLKWKGK